MSGPFDNDGDSQMQQPSTNNSPSATSELFPDASKPSTPAAQTIPAYLSDLSPPDSQGGVPLAGSSTNTSAMAAATPSASGANANGKRPISSIDAASEGLAGATASALALGTATAAAAASAGPAGSKVADAPQGAVKTHGPSGYSWVRQEDEPGFAWRNKKAMAEYNRTWEDMADKDRTVGNRYGDIFAMVDQEFANMKNQGQPVHKVA